MVFTSDRQRKAVMAKLNQGSIKSDVTPTIVNSLSFDAPSFEKRLNDKELIAFAKKQLSINTGQGLDKSISSKSLSNPRQAKKFLRSIGLLRENIKIGDKVTFKKTGEVGTVFGSVDNDFLVQISENNRKVIKKQDLIIK